MAESSKTCSHAIPANITSSIAGRIVYKDECAKCFVDNKSAEGVFVCMTCFVGFCKSHVENHVKGFNHPVFTRVKAQKKEKEEKEPKKITKLAIGKPGGAAFEDEEWELIAEMHCLKCKKEIDSSKFQGVVESILKADSFYKKQMVAEWELNIHPCEHSLTLHQEPKRLADKSLATCSKCELSGNLWLCLTCGNLACGRKQADGSGGNGHAMVHFQESKHPLVVKTGTISSEGDALTALYCYSCDDDVKDEALPHHLFNFGIDVAVMSKTEKTITELNVDINNNLRLSNTLEKGRLLTPMFGPGLTGIVNVGNSCYMASTVQLLLNIPEFVNQYGSTDARKHLEACKKFSPECIKCQTSKLVSGLASGEYSKPIKEEETLNDKEGKPLPEEFQYKQEGVRPLMFKTLIGKGHHEFQTSKQQDAVEYLTYLLAKLDALEDGEGVPKTTNVMRNQICTIMKCETCGKFKVRDSESLFFKLPVPLPPPSKMNAESKDDAEKEQNEEYPVQLKDCLSLFIEPSKCQLDCPNCKKKTTFLKSNHIKRFPRFLLLDVQKFCLDGWVPKKLMNNIQLAENVSFSEVRAPDIDPSRIMEDDGQEDEIKVDELALSQLESMGCSRNKSIRALLHNGMNVELALNWIFSNDDPALDEPIQSKKGGAKKSESKCCLSQDEIEMAMSMGYSEEMVRAAAKAKTGLETVINFLMEDPDAVYELVERIFFQFSTVNFLYSGKTEEKLKASRLSPAMEEEDRDAHGTKTTYEPIGGVVHLGRSTHCGHYVCYSKKEGKWVLFNDQKVAKSVEPDVGKSQLLLLRRTNL